MLKTNMSSFCHLSLLIVYGVKTSHLSSFCHFSLICSFFTMLKPHLSSVPSFISNLLIVHDVKTPHLSSFRYFSPICSLFMMTHTYLLNKHFHVQKLTDCYSTHALDSLLLALMCTQIISWWIYICVSLQIE